MCTYNVTKQSTTTTTTGFGGRRNDGVTVDIDELKEQLGIDKIMTTINTIARRLNQIGVAEYLGSGAPDNQSEVSMVTAFDQTSRIDFPEVSLADKRSKEEFILHSLFEETEQFGPEIQEVIAQRINDTCSKKPMDCKLKDLQEKYKTPSNCQNLCVPKVNTELWLDLPEDSKNLELRMHELQKSITPVLRQLACPSTL